MNIKKKNAYLGVYSEVAIDHGLTWDEILQFEKTWSDRLRDTVLSSIEIKEDYRTRSHHEREEELNQNYGLSFDNMNGNTAVMCCVGKKAFAVNFLGDEFLWWKNSAEELGATKKTIFPVINAIISAFKPSAALIYPDRRFYPGSWVTELVDEGMGICDILDRFKQDGEPAPLGYDELVHFLSAYGPARDAMLEQYFLLKLPVNLDA